MMSRVLGLALFLLWGAAAGWGLWKSIEYGSTAAEVRTARSQWPADFANLRDRLRPTLVVFVHPKCPCTRATIHELDHLLARYRGSVAVRVIVLKPAGASPGWEQTDLLTQVTALPEALVVIDWGGDLHQHFRATTSGECLLYDADGELVFQGGVTPLRGHEGPSVGQDAITALLLKTTTSVQTAPVFGCALETTADNQ